VSGPGPVVVTLLDPFVSHIKLFLVLIVPLILQYINM
jgi:hypothetical protein